MVGWVADLVLIDAAERGDVFVRYVGGEIVGASNPWGGFHTVGTEERVRYRGIIGNRILGQEEDRYVCICSVELRNGYPTIRCSWGGVYRPD